MEPSAADILRDAEGLLRARQQYEDEHYSPGEVCWDVLEYLDRLHDVNDADVAIAAHQRAQRLATLLDRSVARTIPSAGDVEKFGGLESGLRDLGTAVLGAQSGASARVRQLVDLVRLEISYLCAD